MLDNLLKDACSCAFKQFFNNCPDGLTIIEPVSGKILLANPAFCSLLGYDLEELKLKTALDITPSKDHKITKEALKTVSDKGFCSFEKSYLTCRGSEVHVKLHAWGIYDEETDKCTAAFGMIRDVSNERELLKKAADANLKLTNIIENLEDIFVVIEKDYATWEPKLSNFKWKKLETRSSFLTATDRLEEYFEKVMKTGKSQEIKDYAIPVNDEQKFLYYNILIYKYNGGVALIGREIVDESAKLNSLVSDANRLLDKMLEKKNVKR